MWNDAKHINMILLLTLLLTFCSSPGSSTQESVIIDDALEILSVTSLLDNFGGYYIIGELRNNLDTAVSSVELAISITDEAGVSLLFDEIGTPISRIPFFAILNTLAPGETSPFVYYYDASAGVPANYQVTIIDYQPSFTNRALLTYENIQIVEDGSGAYFLTGEIVNLNSDWVHISGLAGGVRDDTGVLLSADWTGTYSSALAPSGDLRGGDRTPFIISFPVPARPVTQWVLWWDAEISSFEYTSSLNVIVTNSYFDEFGSAHLVGLVKNIGSETLSSVLVAGLYAEDGTVLDAGYLYLVTPIRPGTEIPFDISYFASVNTLEAQAALVSRYTVSYDAWKTYPPGYEISELLPEGELVEKDSSIWHVAGGFVNTTLKNLGAVTVMVSVLDQYGTLIATGYTYCFPSAGKFLPGDIGSYDLTIFLPPMVDTNYLTTATLILGEIAR